MLQHCCCIVNVTLFSRVTLNRKLQSTSNLDHFHARHLPCSCVKSRDDPISNCRVGSAVPSLFLYIYTVNHKKRDILFLTITFANLNRFLQFLYHFNREEILHATVVKFTTSP